MGEKRSDASVHDYPVCVALCVLFNRHELLLSYEQIVM